MKTILTLMAAFALVISVGCAPETPSANNSGSTTSSTTEVDGVATGEFQTVSLKVPGMT
ncbi:MAG: hypothetical protein AAF939_02480 [Planctomycetota bacterium]